jgi:hypothetical protein
MNFKKYLNPVGYYKKDSERWAALIGSALGILIFLYFFGWP